MNRKFETLRNPMADAPVEPPPEQPSDVSLAEQIRAMLASDGRLSDESFDIAVTDGCATFTGRISLEYLRVVVDAHASSVPGVLVVKNQLEVMQDGPMADRDTPP